MPKLSTGDAIYRVVAGDNYPRIAAAQGVDEAELRAANNQVDIVPGLIMKIPKRVIVAMPPPEVEAIRESTPSDHDRGLVEAIPVQTAGAPRAQPDGTERRHSCRRPGVPKERRFSKRRNT